MSDSQWGSGLQWAFAVGVDDECLMNELFYDFLARERIR